MQDFLHRLYQATPRAWVTYTVLGINLLVWLLMLPIGVDWLNPRPAALLVLGGNFLPATIEQPWRLFSSTVLHAGALHLGFNMWALWSMGQIAERFYGNLQFALIYLLAGLFGSLASLFASARDAVSVGASGAIFGVAGALLAALFTKPHKLPPALVASMRSSLLFFVGYSLFMGFSSEMIDNAAHIGGLLSGFLLAMAMVERFDWDEFSRRGMIRAALAVFGALAAAGAMWLLVPAPVAVMR